jgi:23S rRNA (cytidine2498-2'-O)-methyltransferase
MRAAIAELQQLEQQLLPEEEMTTSIYLCSVPDVAAFLRRVVKTQLIFVRHLAPIQAIVELTSTQEDFILLANAIADLPAFSQFERGVPFAVQARLAQGERQEGVRPYSSGKLNQALAGAFADETGAVEAIKKPRVIVSLLCTPSKGYVGISTAEENLSSWTGGEEHFAQTPEQVSRAEFKLLEALDVFNLSLPQVGQALDLGAAPGGWTRILLEAGLHVVAVDPARLDARVERLPHLEHYRGYAEDYIAGAIQRRQVFDIIVNDMRMDARDAARLLAQAARCLQEDGIVISVFKLPHATPDMHPLVIFKDALRTLHSAYGVVQAHQLFHNRQEITAVAAQPQPHRLSPSSSRQRRPS